jgi:hypothetical protein
MTRYELHFLDKLDFVVFVRAYTSDDDLGALEQAERLSITHTIEIWDGLRKVARIKKGNASLQTGDRLGG